MRRCGATFDEIVLVLVLVLGFLGKVQAEHEDEYDDEDDF